MKEVFSDRVSDSCSDNLKSAIQNPKWAGLLALAIAFVLCGAVAEAQQTTKFEFVINLNAAKQIGLTLSPEFLARANRVIK
jgi:hypothetical protein